MAETTTDAKQWASVRPPERTGHRRHGCSGRDTLRGFSAADAAGPGYPAQMRPRPPASDRSHSGSCGTPSGRRTGSSRAARLPGGRQQRGVEHRARQEIGDVDGGQTPSTSCSRSDPVTKPTRSTPRILHHTLDVKGWLASPPSPEAARPGACPDCGTPSRPTGGRLGLHGHGLRDRQLRGPVDASGPPTCIVIACRRYCCVSCGAILTVVPRGGAPRRHYGHAAIAMALTLWAIAREPVAEVC